jgi:hypothetical protein
MTIKTDPFSMVQRATKKAFQKMGQVSQVEADPDLRLYQTLKPEDFTKLVEVYGEDDIVNYIRDMESQRLIKKGGK